MKLIDKDKLEAFLNELIEKLDDSVFDRGYLCAIDTIFGCYLNTIEVKEVQEEPVSEDLAKNPELSGWVARDKDGNLHVFEVKPKRSIDDCRWWDRDYKCSAIDRNAFRDLKWEDEPVCVKLIIIKED